MPHTRSGFNPPAMALLAALLVWPAAASSAAVDTYFERGFMVEAGARCRLFAPEVQSALISAREQARGVALREGASVAGLRSVADRARTRGLSTPCDSAELAAAARRVRSGFEGYAQTIRQDFPGDRLGWKADRSISRQQVLWRLSQDVTQDGSRMRFGIAGRGGADSLMAVASFPGGASPYAARIVMRDQRLTAGAYLDMRGESLRTLPLHRRIPPGGPFVSYTAEARSPAGEDLLMAGVKSGWAFRFPAKAAAAISELDPREAIMVEFLFSSGPPRRLHVEVGDFAAARAFLSITRS